MPMRLRIGLALAVLAGPVGAEPALGPAQCADLEAVVEAATGLDLTAPPAAMRDGWCVLDGARSSGDAEVRVSAVTLRLRGEVADDRLVALEIEATGLRVAPALNNRDMPDWLRDLLRLQSAELQLSLRRDDDRDAVLMQRCRLALSGGSEFVVTGEVAGAELTAASLLTGRLTQLYLEWKNDGRILRPLLEAWGAEVEPGATGTKAVLAARAAMQELIDAMPAGTLLDGLPEGASGLVASMPEGRGRMMLMLDSDSGIGAAQLGLLAISSDPMGPEALARFFAGTQVSVSWTPGLAP